MQENEKKNFKGEIHLFQMINSNYGVYQWTYTNRALNRKLNSPGTFGHSEPGNKIVRTQFLELELLPLSLFILYL